MKIDVNDIAANVTIGGRGLRWYLWLLCALVFSIYLYVCKTWTLTADLQRRIQAMKMRCYYTLMGISYWDHVSNERGMEDAQSVHWPAHQSPENSQIEEAGMAWTHYAKEWSHQNSLTRDCGWEEKGKGKIDGGNVCLDNIEEWTGQPFLEMQGLAHDQQWWRQFVCDSLTWCPSDSHS